MSRQLTFGVGDNLSGSSGGAVFEPTSASGGGSAPKYAGNNCVNPTPGTAVILTARMMFDWLGESKTEEVLVYGANGLYSPQSQTMSDIRKNIIHSNPEILGGVPVFVGTRVPVKNLWDYLEAGDTLDRFLEHFPGVTREQAIAALEMAREILNRHASAA